MLKIQWPHRESEHEAGALELWDGDGAVRLLAHDGERHALLLERCRPGTYLGELDAEAALGVLIGLLPRFWKPAGPLFRSLADEAAWWAGYIRADWDKAGRPFEEELVDAALTALEELAPTQGEQVLIHQDLHADNVLAAQREPWLVIDPKPLVGERELEASGLLRNTDSPSRWLDVLSDLGFDRERARGWGVAHNLAWAWDEHEGWLDEHVAEARRILSAR